MPALIPFTFFLEANISLCGILSKMEQPAETNPKYDEWYTNNCILLGWMFNSIEERIYHLFMYRTTIHGLWTALSKMYSYAHFDSRIFGLYQDISHASQATLGLSMSNYFGYL